MTTPAPFLSRHLGDYLLVAQLSEDSLGTVFRALCAADERRFVAPDPPVGDSPDAIERVIQRTFRLAPCPRRDCARPSST
jgi:hypothetical protein